ncbi:hypothetical protein ABZ639_05655 [Saccharomonospora sp. NPDC006951]
MGLSGSAAVWVADADLDGRSGHLDVLGADVALLSGGLAGTGCQTRSGASRWHRALSFEVAVKVLRSLPVKDRPGKQAWLGPAALGLAIVSWLTPAFGIVVGAVAAGCGIVSMSTRREYRLDWTAVAGAVIGGGQVAFSGLMAGASAFGW